MDILKEQICKLVDKSISNKQHNESLIFSIPHKTVIRIKSLLGLNMKDYHCSISSSGIRHVYYQHTDDVKYICESIEIIQKFNRIEKSITKDKITGENLVSIEFYKRYDNDVVKLVKLRILRKKVLELKTLFVQ